MRYFPLILAVIALGAQAQNMKPGLWEITQAPQQTDPKLAAQMAEAQKQMAAMPPEQRKMMEQMMAKQGVSMNLSGGTISLKACISEEQARRNTPPVTDKGNCTHDVQRSGNVIKTRFTCNDPAASGESEVTVLDGGNGFSSTTRITHKAGTTTVSGDARWLGSDCGGLKAAGSK